MSRGSNQKLKLIYLIKILTELTDEEHSITMPEILTELERYGVRAERKSIYDDMESIRELGIDVIGEQRGKNYYYHVGKKQFELAELKLLVDAVQSSKFITAKKSNELIKKIEGFASKYEAKQLQRQVVVSGRIKTMNESIYYNVDAIHTAIGNNKKIAFQYYNWNIRKEMELRKGGAKYVVSPWALSWDDENYYLIAFDSEAGKIKHFRVDKMTHIDAVDEVREGKEFFKQFNMASYAKKNFGMYSGESVNVRMRFRNELAGVVIDRFGKEIFIIPDGEEHFITNVEIAVSGQFFGWMFALGTGAQILGPESVVAQMQQKIQEVKQLYEKA